MLTRVARLRAEMRRRSLDAVIVTHRAHVQYLSGFSGSSGFVLVTPRKTLLVTDFRYAEQAVDEVRAGVRCLIWKQSPYDDLRISGVVGPGMTVGYQESSVTIAVLDAMRTAFKKVRFAKTGDLVARLFIAKEAHEIQAIRAAARIADRVYKEILETVRPGMREAELAAELSYRGRCHGSEGDAFDVIVASGPRGALPHGRASARRIRRGEMVTVDFGCTVRGFHSDMTRTFAVGRPRPEAGEIHALVLQAEQAGVRSARSGMSNRELDEVCRSLIRDAGYGEYFGHGTGHGLGIDVHEAPGISFKAVEEPLIPGMVVTIEPGVYLPGRFGVRIEDDIVITERGRDVLTGSPRELIVV